MQDNFNYLNNLFLETKQYLEFGDLNAEDALINLNIEIMDEIRSLNNYPVSMINSTEMTFLTNLRMQVNELKEKNNFDYEINENEYLDEDDLDDGYDEESELDMMFPDRHDDDFDEDSMSWDSVFGDD
ncbi:hypothetical protein [Soonwooa sp.]|uniref:hypothetical protein n=1 Tax=Soonwooa sp. TaxID=1938592 RepID=UPI0028ACA095|nr:hypothetical protein [Soonwooa sp.]